jgi:hypothetical protein|uniref:Uncharacterized protein n=1 Tax=Zea mays TaxID=4577 RepID=A0A804MX15_MAIZE
MDHPSDTSSQVVMNLRINDRGVSRRLLDRDPRHLLLHPPQILPRWRRGRGSAAGIMVAVQGGATATKRTRRDDVAAAPPAVDDVELVVQVLMLECTFRMADG